MNQVYQNNQNFAQPQQPQNIPTTQKYGDIIDQLPSDKTQPSHDEIRIVDSLFKKKKGVFDKILSETKDVLVIGILFVIFSIPQIDELIKKVIKITQTSPYILILIKSVIFMLCYFILKYFYLSRK